MRTRCLLLLALASVGVDALKPSTAPSLPLVGRQQHKKSASELLAAGKSQGTSDMTTSTANLVKSIIGSGVLSLPVGIAAFSSSKSALLPACLIMTVIGIISAYCFIMVGRVVESTGASTWGEAWAQAVGEDSAWVPTTLVALLTTSASLQYSMVIGDSFSAIFRTVPGLKFLGKRWASIVAVTLFGTLPLSLLPNLDKLKFS